jgi:hypothetical protein
MLEVAVCNFICRHPGLRLRKLQITSAVRVKGFTKETSQNFLICLSQCCGWFNFSPHRLFKYNKTAVTVVQHKVCKCFSLKGKWRFSSLSPAERVSIVTIATCVNANVTYVPPFLVCPGNNMQAGLLDGTPPGSIAACHKAGWVQKESFTQWLKHFVRFMKPSKKYPVILTLDGHFSHSRNIEVIESSTFHVCLSLLPCAPVLSANNSWLLRHDRMVNFRRLNKNTLSFSEGICQTASSKRGTKKMIPL